MKNEAIRTPSGRSITLTTVVYRNTRVMRPNSRVAKGRPRRRAERVTATDADNISTSTPVA
jgi:hypothetical protein